MTDWILTLGDMSCYPQTSSHWQVTDYLADTIREVLGDPYRETLGTEEGIVVL